ncbi:MAG: hypothetical protein ACI9OH_003306, partial [Oleispira sp.]
MKNKSLIPLSISPIANQFIVFIDSYGSVTEH